MTFCGDSQLSIQTWYSYKFESVLWEKETCTNAISTENLSMWLLNDIKLLSADNLSYRGCHYSEFRNATEII